jgi:hypothetical protein
LRTGTASLYGSCSMKLYVIQKAPNFGDQLNFLVYPKLLGPIFDNDASLVLLGIGTVIGANAPAGRHEIILGAGAGYQQKRHSLDNRTVYTVRGPGTARLLGLEERFVSIDPGVLVERLHPAPASQRPTGTLFMPHWQTEQSAGEQWRDACAQAGIEYVSPVGDTMAILEKLRNCKLLISEALHGAVVAECFGRPWVPVVLGPKVLDFKWRDWCASIGIRYQPHENMPLLHDFDERVSLNTYFKRAASSLGFGKTGWHYIATRRTSQAEAEEAATELSRIAANADRLAHRGSRKLYDRGVERLLTAIDDFKRDWQAGRFEAYTKSKIPA